MKKVFEKLLNLVLVLSLVLSTIVLATPIVFAAGVTVTYDTSITYYQGDVVLLTANPTDISGITNIAFYDGTTLLGNVTSAPYTFNYINLPMGTRSITAKVTDSISNVTTSAAVIVNVQEVPPSKTVFTGADFSSYTGGLVTVPTGFQLWNLSGATSTNTTSAPNHTGDNCAKLVTTAGATNPYRLYWSNAAAQGLYKLLNVVNQKAEISIDMAFGDFNVVREYLKMYGGTDVNGNINGSAVIIPITFNTNKTISYANNNATGTTTLKTNGNTGSTNFVLTADTWYSFKFVTWIDGTNRKWDFYINGTKFIDGYVMYGSAPPSGTSTLYYMRNGYQFGNSGTSTTLTSTTYVDNAYAYSYSPSTVVITSVSTPTNNTSAIVGTPVALNATASTSDTSTIQKVQYYQNGQLIGESATAPYTVNATLPIGTYSIIARAVSTTGFSGYSTPVTFTTEPNPVVPITSLNINTPANLEQDSADIQNVQFSVETVPASNVDTSLIEWYVNGVKQSTSGVEFSFNPPMGLGSYAVYAAVKETSIVSETRTINVTGEGFAAITELGINNPPNLAQTMGAVEPVVFTVTTTPVNNVDLGTIKWYVNDIKQIDTSNADITGGTFAFSSTSAGTYRVYAKTEGNGVASPVKTVTISQAATPDVGIFNEQFNYELSTNFASALPSQWSRLQITGTGTIPSTASVTVAADPEDLNPVTAEKNRVLEVISPEAGYEGVRMFKNLPTGLAPDGQTPIPVVVTGMIRVPRGTGKEPSFSMYMSSTSNRQLLSVSSAATGLIQATPSDTNTTLGYRTNDGWVRYTAMITVNPTNLAASKASFMLSGNGNISATNGGVNTYRRIDNLTVNLSGISNINTVAPSIAFYYTTPSGFTSRPAAYYDDMRIYYPKSLTASLDDTASVAVDKPLLVKFNHNVDPSTLIEENITLKKTDTGEIVGKTIKVDALHTDSITVTPSADFDYGTDYTVEFNAVIKDIANLSVSNTLRFITAPEPGEPTIGLNYSDLSLQEESISSQIKVFIDDEEIEPLADSTAFEVESSQPAVADWVDGKIVTGIPGEAILTFRSTADGTEATVNVTVTAAPRAQDWIKSVSIPSEEIVGQKQFYEVDGALDTAWTTAIGEAPYAVADPSPSVDANNKVMAFKNGMGQGIASDYGVPIWMQTSSVYVFETKMRFSSAADGVQIRANEIGSLFKVAAGSASNKKSVYLGASTNASGLEIDADTWYHFKAMLHTDENSRVTEIRYFIDGTEVFQLGQMPMPYTVSKISFYNPCLSNADEAMRVDGACFYQTQESAIKGFLLPSEKVEGTAVYTNKGFAETWSYQTGTPELVIADPLPNRDICNTVLAFRNGTRVTSLSKALTLDGSSTYVYETKVRLSADTHDFSISMDGAPGKYNLINFKDNDETSKIALLGASMDGSGLILPIDTWFAFKAVLNLDVNKKLVEAHYFIDNTEQYQQGQEVPTPYTVNRIGYTNMAVGMGEAARLDDTTIYRTTWLTGITASVAEFKVAGEEFDSAAQVTKPGWAKVRITVEDGTRNAITPVVVVQAGEGSTLRNLGVSDGSVVIQPGKKGNITLYANIPDGLIGEKLRIHVYDNATDLKPLINPLEKVINTAGKLDLESIYSDGMVLQRGAPINISGRAPTGATVTVDFAGKQTSVVAQGNRFTVLLPAEVASFENRTLTVTAQKEGFSDSITYQNVQVGDVYYGSGQSNMDLTMQSTYGSPPIPSGVRFIKISRTPTAAQRVDKTTNLGEVWKDLNSSTFKDCAAVMFFMADGIRKKVADVPIAIIDCSWGGSSIGAWVGEDVYLNNPAYAAFKNDFYNDAAINTLGVGDLYYNMVKPIMSFGFKAAVWYQGEQDYGREYEKLLPAMIREYRSDLGRELPFIVVQIPGYNSVYTTLRFRQDAAVKALTNTYLEVTNDTGNNTDIHPTNKDTVGDRAARIALNRLYGLGDVPYYGPRYKSMSVSGNTATLTFDYANDGTHGGLCSLNSDGSLPGFELAGNDKVFKAASATIVGDTVQVTSNLVTAPVYVRYGYVGEIFRSLGNNTNGTILPAACFRTDMNYSLSGNANLSSLSYNGAAISGFDAAVTEYNVELSSSIQLVSLSGTVSDIGRAAVSYNKAALTGFPDSIIATVTAEDGTTKTYKVNFTVHLDNVIPAPSVTVDDINNTIIGLDLDTMEVAISADGGATYSNFTSQALPVLGGSKLVKVRIKADGNHPCSEDTVLTFTPNAGDVSGDGNIDISDAIMTAEIAVGYTNYLSEQITRANVSSKTDPTVDISDVVLLIERVVGGIAPFPVELP